MIRVLIAEDQAMVLGALAALITIEQDISVVAQARNGRTALADALAIKPDIVLTDIEMPEMTGLELAAELRRRGSPARVIILTTFARSGFLRRALDSGASGYLLKDAPAERLADAIRRVHAGGRAIDPGSPPNRGPRIPIPSPIANGRSCASPPKDSRPPISPPPSSCRRGPCATTSRRSLASSAPAIAWTRHALPA